MQIEVTQEDIEKLIKQLLSIVRYYSYAVKNGVARLKELPVSDKKFKSIYEALCESSRWITIGERDVSDDNDAIQMHWETAFRYTIGAVRDLHLITWEECRAINIKFSDLKQRPLNNNSFRKWTTEIRKLIKDTFNKEETQ